MGGTIVRRGTLDQIGHKTKKQPKRTGTINMEKHQQNMNSTPSNTDIRSIGDGSTSFAISTSTKNKSIMQSYRNDSPKAKNLKIS